MDESAGIMVVGATNMPELIDPALLRPGRFDKIIYIPPPDFEARKNIFRLYLKNKPLAHGMNFYELAGSTDGFSGADIENVVKEASMRAMRRTLDSRKRAYITMEDFRAILQQIKPSITKKMQKEYEKLGFDYSRKTGETKKKKAKKAKKKARGRKSEYEEEDSTSIEVGDGEISWEGEDEEEDVETDRDQVWDKFVPPKKTRKKKSRRRRAKEDYDDDVVFQPVESEDSAEDLDSWDSEDEFVIEDDSDEDSDSTEAKPKRKSAYHPDYDGDSEEESSDDYWM
jgi:hypothetical protein